MSNQSLPILESERLILRPIDLNDLEACLAMDSQPEVRRFFGIDDGEEFDQETHRDFLRKRIQGSYGGGLGFWSIREQSAQDKFCGWIVLIELAYEGPEIEIGWRLPFECWGNGFATDGARLVLKHGFHTLGLDEIIAVFHPNNVRSFAVADRLGMKDAGMRHAYKLDLPCRRLTRGEFEAQGTADV